MIKIIIRSEVEFTEMLDSLAQAKRYAIDTEGVKKIYPDWKLTGTSISFDGKNGYYIPSGHLEGSGQLPDKYVVEKLKPFFNMPGKFVYMANQKYDMRVFRLVDPTVEFLEENAFCTMTASFILDVNNEHNLKDSVMRELGHKMLTLDEIGCPKITDKVLKDKVYFPDKLTIEKLAPYAIDDAVQTYRLGELYREKIASEGYNKVFYELEMPFMFILMEMEDNGVLLDRVKLTNFIEDAPKKLKQLEEEIYDLIPMSEINFNSNQQMNHLLFKVLKIRPRGELLKSGYYSVTNEYLDLWASEHKICGMVADYRRLSKLFGNYLHNLGHRVSPDGRIRSNFNSHVTATGRLSSSKPNLQNIPRAENDTYGLRKIFRAEEGKDLIVADYSQIELRVIAHLSKDPEMIRAFQEGQDIHSTTAKDVFKLDCLPEEVKAKYPIKRQIAKSVNFGLIYEAGAKTLAGTANKEIEFEKDYVTEQEMEIIIQDYFRKYGYVQKHIDLCHRKAMQDGYVKTIVGRRRYLKNAQIRPNSRDDHRKRYGAFRQATNTPVQGSAADILKIAMRNIKRKLLQENLFQHAKTVLQVHDEVLYEVDSDCSKQVATIVKDEMENAVVLRVPLVADVAIGKVWGDIK